MSMAINDGNLRPCTSLLRAAPAVDLCGEFSTLIVQDARAGQRWLAREHLADYLRALLADDPERLLLLTRPLEAA